MLNLNTHTPITQRSQSGLFMLSRHSVGTRSRTTPLATLSHSHLNLLSYCGLILACWSPLKKTKSTGGEWTPPDPHKRGRSHTTSHQRQPLILKPWHVCGDEGLSKEHLSLRPFCWLFRVVLKRGSTVLWSTCVWNRNFSLFHAAGNLCMCTAC